MSSNKLIPDLRFPEFENEGEWEEKLVSQLAEYENGKAHEQDINEEGKYVVVNSKFISTDGEVRKFTNSANCIARADDILMVLSDVPNGRAIAKCFYVDRDNFYTVNQRICKLTPTNADSKILYYLLNRNSHFLSFDDGVKQTNLRNEDVLNCPIILPKSPQEQQKIASCLSSLDELISAHNIKLELLKDHKKGLMQNLFPQEGEKVPKYRFTEFEKDGEWVEKKLGEVAENLDSKRIPITSTQREKGSIPYYGASGIIDYVKDFIFDETLLCISEDGANLIDRNYPIAFTISGKTWVNNHSHVLRFANFDTQILVEKYINSINVQDFLTGMAQPKLNRGKLDIIPIPLPKNPKEQQKIASCLSSLDALITAQAEKIAQLKVHKKGLMQGLFPRMND